MSQILYKEKITIKNKYKLLCLLRKKVMPKYLVSVLEDNLEIPLGDGETTYLNLMTCLLRIILF